MSSYYEKLPHSNSLDTCLDCSRAAFKKACNQPCLIDQLNFLQKSLSTGCLHSYVFYTLEIIKSVCKFTVADCSHGKNKIFSTTFQLNVFDEKKLNECIEMALQVAFLVSLLWYGPCMQSDEGELIELCSWRQMRQYKFFCNNPHFFTCNVFSHTFICQMIWEKIKQLSNFYMLLRSPILACHTEWYRIIPKKRSF